jgi:hypothetical protein
LETAGATPEQAAGRARKFAPVHSCGGVVAAAGVLLFAVAGLVTTLPGFPLPLPYPVWLVWALRVAPVPALVLLWAVTHEAEFKVRTDSSAIHFRKSLGPTARLPWREVTDYFADCGRSPRDVATSGGSLVHEALDARLSPHAPPFASYRPDYTLLSNRGTFVFDDGLSGVSVLAQDISSSAPQGTPDTWEEASWLTCRRCDERTAVSLWQLLSGDRVRYCDRCRAPSILYVEGSTPMPCACGGEFVQEAFTCPACGESYGVALPSPEDGFVLERRGAMQHSRPWRIGSALPRSDLDPQQEQGGEDDAWT